MRAETIRSFVDFVNHSELFDLLVEQTLFRGQPVQGNLLPSIARADPSVNTVNREEQTLEQLKMLGASFLPTSTETTLDLLVRAQHFGLKTRLLDWTSNSLAALWFACSDKTTGDVFVYAIEVDDLLLKSDVYDQNPFKIAKTRAFLPRLNNARIIAQHGWFTLHRYSKQANKYVPLEKNPDTKNRLHELRIPAGNREQILRSLDRHGVNRRTLFPDIDGLCGYLNWKYDAT